uniref:EML-like first beta-propeller domain-containing protein n=1 Tax=Oryzias melastigma TaxID=30732 RepID=A0A3B3CEV5_ORYME
AKTFELWIFLYLKQDKIDLMCLKQQHRLQPFMLYMSILHVFLSLAVHPDKITIATGQVAGTSSDGKQLAPHVRVWDSVSLSTLHVLGAGFFDRAVVCLAFSKSVRKHHLCISDILQMEETPSVTDWLKLRCSSNESVFAADFHPTDSNVVVTCGKSHIFFWTLEKGVLVKKQGLFEKQEKPKFVICVTFAENGDAITGDSSGNILVWGKGTIFVWGSYKL